MKTQTRSPTPYASRSRDYANGSANPGSSPPWPASATTSTRNQTPGVSEKSVDRAPGLSVRLKLTLSYAGFLMLAGAVLLTAAYFADQHRLSFVFLDGAISATGVLVHSNADLVRNFAPIAAIVMAFLLVFGLLGGWLLAGRMLAPLTHITDATRAAAKASSPTESSYRAAETSFANSPTASTPCSRGSKHTSRNNRDSQPTPPTNYAPHWRSRRHFSTWPATIEPRHRRT